MWAYISTIVKSLAPLTGEHYNILEHYDFDTIVSHNNVDMISTAHHTYINTSDKSKFRYLYEQVHRFDEETLDIVTYNTVDMQYPIISLNKINTSRVLSYVIENINTLYMYEEHPWPNHKRINTITLDYLWKYIIINNCLSLVPTMLIYDNMSCYNYMLTPAMVLCLLEHDKNALQRSYQPDSVESFDILDEAGYDFNLSPDYNMAILELCEDDFNHYSKVLEKLLIWEDKEGNKYNFNIAADEWSPEVVGLVSQYRDLYTINNV